MYPRFYIRGPLLFIIYVNNICNVSNFLNLVLVADDTNTFASDDDINKLCLEKNCELEKFNKCFRINKLSLNVKKINFMIFSNRKYNLHNELFINNSVIDQVNSTIFLGVIIDSKLCWKEQISRVKEKLSKCILVIGKSK